jgi:hypothetical protein
MLMFLVPSPFLSASAIAPS